MGKGCAPRPYAKSRADYERRWEETFKKKKEVKKNENAAKDSTGGKKGP